MNLHLEGKKAIVMAGTSGLGLAIARELCNEGSRVAICGRDEERLADAVQEIARSGQGSIQAFRCDVAQATELETFFSDAADTLGGIDILVTNAGGPRPGRFDSMTDESWTDAFNLTLMSVVRSVRYALPYLRASGTGSVLALTSSSIKAPIPNLLLSNVFRPAVAALCKTLAEELAPDAIRVNVLAPGRIATPRVSFLDEQRARASGRDVEDIRLESESTIPLRRYGSAEEFAKVAVFLVSGAASYVTGTTTLVDGGLVRSL